MTEPAAGSESPPPATIVTARPVRSARIAIVAAAVVVGVLGTVAVILPGTADGVSFTGPDQFGVAGVGVLIAIGILAFVRPRLRADASGVDTKGFFGGYRHVDWDLVVAVEFPPKVRFARLVLPGDELIPLYAVQRGDGERSVVVMDGLRALHAQSRE
jgi:PH (Pleckstrin Homology) domain-containing protein